MNEPLEDQSAENASNFRLEKHIPYLLVRSANQIGGITQKLYQDTTPAGLTLSLREFRTLLIVAVRGFIGPAAVADATGMDRSTVTRALAALRSKSLVEESPNENDKRAKVLKLTDKGRVLCDEIFPKMAAYDDLLDAEFSKDEINQFNSMLNRLVYLFVKGSN
jgi:DNA-binding MarR family transcriptional regulator